MTMLVFLTEKHTMLSANHPKFDHLIFYFHEGAVLDNSELGYHGEHEKVTDKSG